MPVPSVMHPQLGFGTVVSEQPELEDEIIGRGDSRRPVNDTTKPPYRWICQIIATVQDPTLNKGDPTKFIGTGLLIGPRHVLTAAHTVWFQSQAGAVYRAKQVDVAPGRSRGLMPFGTYRVAGASFPKEYIPGVANCHDYALLKLGEDISGKRFPSIKNQWLSYWGSREKGNDTRLEFVDPAKLRKQTVHVVGYAGDKCGFMPIVPFKPGDKCYVDHQTPGSKTLKQCLDNGLAGSAQYGDKGRVLEMRAGGPQEFLIYDADTCGAQSGGPVWMQSGGNRYLVGIHAGEFTLAQGTCQAVTAGSIVDANRAVRLDKTVISNILSWI